MNERKSAALVNKPISYSVASTEIQYLLLAANNQNGYPQNSLEIII